MTSSLTLNNGLAIPQLGLGVYQSSSDETIHAVQTALEGGYRLIDTAAAYFNEREVGEGMRRSGIPRSEIFLTTKLWMNDYGYDNALRAFETSTTKLGVDNVDLYLLHWPVPSDWEKTVGAYKAAERLLADGRVKAIGVCNFTPENIAALADVAGVIPAVNQVELHPYFRQSTTQQADVERGIVTEAWSPIGGVNMYSDGADPAMNVLQDETISQIAATVDKSAAQVILRWHIQQGRIAIPKSVRPNRIAENFDVFDFELSADQLASIDSLDTGKRGGPDPDTVYPALFGLDVDPA